MTTKCPHAQWDPLGDPADTPRMSRHDIVCLHTMAGSFAGVDALFHADGFGGTESHFGVAGSGFAKQWQDLEHRADANYEGNHRVISIETADRGENFPVWEGGDVPAWTDAQIDKIVDITAWCCKKYDIPPRLVKSSESNERGIAYHRQGIDGNYTDGFLGRQGRGERWSTGDGKLCPATRRIKQTVNVIIPLVRAEIEGPPDYDFLVRATKNGKTKERVFERARRGLRRHVMEMVRDDWRVVIKKVKDQDR